MSFNTVRAFEDYVVPGLATGFIHTAILVVAILGWNYVPDVLVDNENEISYVRATAVSIKASAPAPAP